jgi:hypothetical protein
MLAQSDLGAILQWQQVANNANNSYHYEYKNFKEWVKAQPELHTPMSPFLTCVNVDHYFSCVISHHVVCPNIANRVMNALDWYGTHREHVGADPACVCKSALAAEGALKSQKVYNELHGGNSKPGSDPHMGIKDPHSPTVGQTVNDGLHLLQAK